MDNHLTRAPLLAGIGYYCDHWLLLLHLKSNRHTGNIDIYTKDCLTIQMAHCPSNSKNGR